MSTALAARPVAETAVAERATATWPPQSGGLFRRVGALRRTSPGRLQLLQATLITITLLTGLVAGLVGYETSTGTSDLGDRAQPLLIEAETIYSGLADADTTAAQAFLAGGLEPAALTQRYDADLDRVSTALAAAARRTPETGEAADAIKALSTGLSRYTALVATARAVNRQGLPVGSSYLSAASTLSRDQLIPEAQTLFRLAQSAVQAGYTDATSPGWLVTFGLLLAVLLVALLTTQGYLSRRTNRTFNVPMVTATVLTVLLTLGSLTLLTTQNAHLRQAAETGSRPASELAEARILALRERGDEALTLAGRGSNNKEDDFGAAKTAITEALDNAYVSDDVRAAHRDYVATHDRVRFYDDGGDYARAVELAVSGQISAPFERVLTGLDTALDHRKDAFTAQIGKAGRGLDLLTILGPLIALVVCVLILAGIRARLEEYR